MRPQCNQFKHEFNLSMTEIAKKLDKSVVWVRHFICGDYKNQYGIFSHIRVVSETLGIQYEDIAKYALGTVGNILPKREPTETYYEYNKRLEAILSSENIAFNDLITRSEVNSMINKVINKIVYGE
jgi:hypothetical protein